MLDVEASFIFWPGPMTEKTNLQLFSYKLGEGPGQAPESEKRETLDIHMKGGTRRTGNTWPPYPSLRRCMPEFCISHRPITVVAPVAVSTSKHNALRCTEQGTYKKTRYVCMYTRPPILVGKTACTSSLQSGCNMWR